MSNTLEYFYTYKTNVKERWKNKSIIEILVYEFRTRSREYFMEAIECGVITVNDKLIRPNYKLQLTDYIKHTVHMHEPEVEDINIIKREDEYLVVHKPAGIPCHPTGGYIEYSITRKLFGDARVACVNRLDMPVSGVLIITFKNLSTSMKKISETEKVYVAKVKGSFPDEVDCRNKIYCEEGRRRFVDERGKECQTLFRRLEYKNGYSLIECRPITGRTHQIRIHLQSLGFPIENDVIYGDAKQSEPIFIKNCQYKWNEETDKIKMECVLKYCRGENNRSFELRNKYICLHAWKYKFNDTWYEAKWPEWTNLF
ncbi:hypothetical protein P3W45_001172 [Vairimorpha bombi]